MSQRYLNQQFEARQFPTVIWIDDHPVVGPFCVHCGNPEFTHGPDARCPNQHLHPLFPSPNLPFEDEAGISREARLVLRRLRAKTPSLVQGRMARTVIGASIPDAVRIELLDAGYVTQVGAWVVIV